MKAEDAGESRLISLCEDFRYAGEPKVDGDRVLVHIGEGSVFFASSTGKDARGSAAIRKDFEPFATSDSVWVWDGELCNGVYHLFDLIIGGSLVTPDMPFVERRSVLEEFFARWAPSPAVQLLPSYTDHYDKALLAKTIKQEKGEGLMFKRLDAPYLPGKRSDAMWKVKFRKDVDCVVTCSVCRQINCEHMLVSRDGKNNMVLSVYRDGELVEVGECTALAGDGKRVQVGDVVCVRLLNVTKDFRLYQPTLPRIRSDKDATECLWEQLPPLIVNKTVYS